MVNFQKVIKITDAFLDCIPFVSSVTATIKMVYATACKVDAFANPVAPGWKRELKLYLLSQPLGKSAIGLVPILGNLFNIVMFFVMLVNKHFARDDDYLDHGFIFENVKLVRFCNNNNIVYTGDSGRFLKLGVFRLENTEIFRELIRHGQWNASSVAQAIGECRDERHIDKLDILLDYWARHQLSWAQLSEPEQQEVSYRVARCIDCHDSEGRWGPANRLTQFSRNVILTRPPMEKKHLNGPLHIPATT